MKHLRNLVTGLCVIGSFIGLVVGFAKRPELVALAALAVLVLFISYMIGFTIWKD